MEVIGVSQTRRGFTLIELLVVIAIIAILAAILFPVFARARAKAQQNTCLSNVKQMNLALIMYASDYDQQYVAWGDVPNDWKSKLAPYVKNTQIFNCPVDRNGELGDAADGEINGYNLNFYYGPLWGTGYPYQLASDTTAYPAEMWCLIDGLGSTRYASTFDLDNDTTRAYSGNCGAAVWRHNEGCNLGYVDGHAKFQAGQWLASQMGGTTPATAYTGNTRFWVGR